MLLDSNIIIGAAKPGAGALASYIAAPEACASIITTIEVLGFHRMPAEEERAIELYLADLTELPLNAAIAGRAIALRKERRMGLADSILAATALEWNLPLVTYDIDDFKHIAGLKLIAPPAVAP